MSLLDVIFLALVVAIPVASVLALPVVAARRRRARAARETVTVHVSDEEWRAWAPKHTDGSTR